MKIKDTAQWGRTTAQARYAQSAKSEPNSPAATEQPPQAPEDKHGAGYENDASGWVRGMGKESPYPTFSPTKFRR